MSRRDAATAATAAMVVTVVTDSGATARTGGIGTATRAVAMASAVRAPHHAQAMGGATARAMPSAIRVATARSALNRGATSRDVTITAATNRAGMSRVVTSRGARCHRVSPSHARPASHRATAARKLRDGRKGNAAAARAEVAVAVAVAAVADRAMPARRRVRETTRAVGTVSGPP